MRFAKESRRQARNSSAPSVAATPEPAAPVAALVEDFSFTTEGRRLGELLLRESLLTHEQLLEALLQQNSSGQRLGSVLVEWGALDERDLARMLAEQLGIEYADLRRETPDEDAVKRLPEAMARATKAIPLRLLDDGGVVVVVADPHADTKARLEDLIGSPVTLVVAAQSEIIRAIGNSYRALSSVGAQVQAFEARDALRKATAVAETATGNDDAPIVQVVNLIITQGLRDRSSDIHIEPQGDRIRVRYRIDGSLHEALSLPGSMGPAMVSRIKIMAGMNIVERRRAQDGQIAMDVEGRAVDIRVATTATLFGEKVVMRLLDKSRPLFRLTDLGMPTDTGETYSKLIRSPYGMVICAGPTGSGKTTTLYGSLSEINQPDLNITTIEDPVEYVFPSINQIQINEQAGVTFAGGLKSILRQDPDVILVGEMRDVETARIAVQSALTGHFVLSSIHATDSVSALHRLLDMGIESFLVVSAVTAVVAQRLVRRTCSSCRRPYEPTREELVFLNSVGGQAPIGGFFSGEGCNFCSNTGYQERIGVYELMVVSEEIKGLVLDRASLDDIRKMARSQGMRTLREEAVRLVESGVTTIAEVLRAIYVVGS